MSLFCPIFGHKRNSQRVWHDGLNYRSNCRRCAKPMLRDSVAGRWRSFDHNTDFSMKRCGKPRR